MQKACVYYITQYIRLLFLKNVCRNRRSWYLRLRSVLTDWKLVRLHEMGIFPRNRGTRDRREILPWFRSWLRGCTFFSPLRLSEFRHVISNVCLVSHLPSKKAFYLHFTSMFSPPVRREIRMEQVRYVSNITFKSVFSPVSEALVLLDDLKIWSVCKKCRPTLRWFRDFGD